MSAPEPAVAGYGNMAKVYDFLLGGKDNLAADRQIASRITELCPQAPALAVANRLYLHQAIRQAVAAGVRLIGDVGCGFPASRGSVAAPNTHELNPGGRTCYVDVDPLVISHVTALSKGPGVSAHQADLRDVGGVLTGLEGDGWDLGQPAALIFGATLNFMTRQESREAVTGYTSRLAPGSRVVITACCYDDPRLAGQVREAHTVAPLYHTTPDGFRALFDGLQMAGGGVERVSGLRAAGRRETAPAVFMACAVGIKR